MQPQPLMLTPPRTTRSGPGSRRRRRRRRRARPRLCSRRRRELMRGLLLLPLPRRWQLLRWRQEAARGRTELQLLRRQRSKPGRPQGRAVVARRRRRAGGGGSEQRRSSSSAAGGQPRRRGPWWEEGGSLVASLRSLREEAGEDRCSPAASCWVFLRSAHPPHQRNGAMARAREVGGSHSRPQCFDASCAAAGRRRARRQFMGPMNVYHEVVLEIRSAAHAGWACGHLSTVRTALGGIRSRLCLAGKDFLCEHPIPPHPILSHLVLVLGSFSQFFVVFRSSGQ